MLWFVVGPAHRERRVSTLELWPAPSQLHARLVQRPAKYTVTSPVASCKVMPLKRLLVVDFDALLHRRLRYDECRASMGKNIITNHDLAAIVQRLVRVELGDPLQQVRPDQVSVRLDEDIPLLVRIHLQSAVDHGQELPLVESPSSVVVLTNGSALSADFARKLIFVEILSASFLDVKVVLEVVVVGFDVVGDVSQNVVDLLALEVLSVVGEDDKVRIALEL